ncbi:class I SAM-dependent methyltransferase, partial [Phascolarctobacterium succinatutens]
MHIDRRLETIANLVPQGCVLADIGTDHAYLPVWLLEKQRIARAIAGDIAAGPCQAARTTVAQYGQHEHVEVRQGSGLKVLSPGEADCIAIAGMGASTIISILEDDMEVAQSAELLVLQ